ncbi:MAG: hypothetical protein FWF29_02235, partial [Treponema sp.]|nr:hypothetical protein [Treponema sp.]
MAGKENARIEIDTSVNQKGLTDGLKKSQQNIKNFVKGAAQELGGVDQLLSVAAPGSGAIAIGKAVVDMGKKAVAALNEMAGAYREQEQAEVALANAAKNNPYLNDRSVKQLSAFATEMQRVTGIDSVQVLQTQTRLASLGRDQDQIQKIVKTAADMAASGVMSYDEAVNELNNSYNGFIRTSGRLFPELKSLSKEALASGEAIDIIAKKVDGSAAKAMGTGAGSVTRFENAVSNLKKIAGEGWENFLRGPRDAFSDVAEGIENQIKHAKTVREAQIEMNALSAEWAQKVKDVDDELADIKEKQMDHPAARTREENKALSDRARELSRLKNQYIDAAKEEKKYSEANLIVQEEGLRIAKLNYDAMDEGQQQDTARGKNLAKEIRDREQLVSEINAALDADKERAAAQAEANKQSKDEADNKAAIDKLMSAYLDKLDKQKKEIIETARLKGIDENSLEVQNQLLDLQISAYRELVNTSGGLITGEVSIEQAIIRTGNALRNRVELEKQTDEERKQRLQELAKIQADVQAKLTKITEDALAEGEKLQDTSKEQKFQDDLLTIKEQSLKKAAEFEGQYRLQQQQENYQAQVIDLGNQYDLAVKNNEDLHNKELENTKAGSAERIAADKRYNDDKLTIEENYNDARAQLTQNNADQRLQIEQDTDNKIKEAHQQMWKDALDAAQGYMNAASSIASSISTIWNNIIDAQTEEKLRQNDEMVQSDEERAAHEEKIQAEAANKRYKAELFAWSANVTMATANM